MIKFIFDLDGTITKIETLPLIAKHFGVVEEIEALTTQTIQGNIPFIESFIRRVHILGSLPVNEISDLLAQVPLYPMLNEFIQKHNHDCIIATGNIDAWVDQLIKKIGCEAFSSVGEVINNKIFKLSSILRKEALVKEFQNKGYRVVFIGDGNNDVEAMRLADVSIASGLTHKPAASVLSVTDYAVFNEKALCRQLNQLY